MKDLWKRTAHGDRFSISDILRFGFFRIFICPWRGHQWMKDDGDDMSYCPRCWALENRGDNE